MTDTVKTDTGRTSRRLDIDIDRARRLYESGLSLRQVAAEFGVTMPTIIDRFKEAGIERRPGGAPPKVIDAARAKQLYEKGVSLKEIGAEFGVTATTITTDLLAAGVELRPGKSSWIDQFKIRRAAELRRAGGSYREIGAAIGRGNGTARAYCFRAGVTARPASQPPPGHRRLEIDLDRAVALYRSGMTLKQVGADLGVAWATVQRRFKEAGVEMRPRGRRRLPQKRDDKPLDAALARPRDTGHESRRRMW